MAIVGAKIVGNPNRKKYCRVVVWCEIKEIFEMGGGGGGGDRGGGGVIVVGMTVVQRLL